MQLSLTSALYVAGFLQSTYLILATPFHRGRVLLRVFLGAIALLTADYFLWENEWLSPTAQFWVNRFTHASLTYLLGPSLYGYLLVSLQPTFRLRPAHQWHLVPYGLALVLAIVFFPRYLPVWETYTQDWLVPATTWPQLMRGLHSLIYAGLAGRLLWRHTTKQQQNSLKNRLLPAILVTGSVCVFVSTGLYLVPETAGWKTHGEATAVLCSVGMLYLVNRLLLTYQPGAVPLTTSFVLVPADSPPRLPPIEKYRHSALDLATAATLLDKLDAHLARSRAYEDPDLTLTQLAQALHVSTNQLSQAINQAGGQPFYGLINHYRITAACRLLTDPNYNHLSVSGIGYEVGFRSKSTYYAAFRREQGITPSAYRKQGQDEA